MAIQYSRQPAPEPVSTIGSRGHTFRVAALVSDRIRIVEDLFKVAVTMTVKIDTSGLKQTKWHEYALRFIAGGVTTLIAGLIARRWGAEIGGLFLAFPAIFPASATLIEKHERERKQKKGLHGEERGTDAAAIDALGTAIGSVGLIGFAGVCCWLIPNYAAPLALGAASFAWLLVSFTIWAIRQGRRRFTLSR
jgi:hypothetical protein